MSRSKSLQPLDASALRALREVPAASSSKPVLWKDFGVYLDRKVDIEPASDSSQSLRPAPDSSYLSMDIDYKVCNTCNRPIGSDSQDSHAQQCTGARRHEIASPEPVSVSSSRQSTPALASATPSQTTSSRPKKKYKKSQTQREKEAANAAAAAAAAALLPVPDTAAEVNTVAEPVSLARKKKLLARSKPIAKAKGPVDVERQCGVSLASGGFCARSLTCKTHSMGAKRAVIGRSAPYDLLLQQYQKRNQAKIAATNALAAQRRENAEFADGSGNGANTGDYGASTGYNRPLDSDEETHAVLEGLSKNNPAPLEQHVLLPTRNRHRFLAAREFYANAFIVPTNSGGAASSTKSVTSSPDQTLATQAISGSIGGLQGRCALINVDQASNNPSQSFSAIPGELYQVRAPLKAILMTAQHNIMQQQAFQQQMIKYQQQQMLLMKQKQARAAQEQQQQKQQQQQQQQQQQPQQPRINSS